MVMLETAQGVQNTRAILETPGIDACFIGPNDLAVSLGYPPQEPLPPAVEEAIARSVLRRRPRTKSPGFGLLTSRR